MTTLDAVVAALPGVVDADADAVAIVDVEHDSRRVAAGSLFACVPGANADGHDFASDAVGAGAAALLVERRLEVNVPQVVVESVRRAMGPAAATVHEAPSLALDVLGVTGTNGKTTTVRFLTMLLGTLGRRVTEIGTLTGERTTPEAPELQRRFAAAVEAGHDAVAMEVSSHALDQRRVDGTRFRVSAFTNLGVDHLDHHADLEAYFEAKAQLFTPERSGFAVVDTTTVAGRRLVERLEIPHVETGPESVDVQEATSSHTRFSWRGAEIELPLAGSFNVSNAVIAAEMLVALGHEPNHLADALAAVGGVPGRFEAVDEGQGFAVFVDYAHTPDGLEVVLDAARAVTARGLTIVFGAGGDRDRSKRPQMGEVARRKADRVIVTSDNPRNEPPDEIISAIVEGMERPPDLVQPDRRAAIRAALADADEGDVVVIAGKGHEATQTIGGEIYPFDDREVTRDELRRLGSFGT